MMLESRHRSKNICSVMIERGITQYDSPEGIELCLNCPFEECELEFAEKNHRSLRKNITKTRRGRVILELNKLGWSAMEISNVVGLSYRTVSRYIWEDKEAKKSISG